MSVVFCFFFKQKTAYEMRISDWSSDVCSSDLHVAFEHPLLRLPQQGAAGRETASLAHKRTTTCSMWSFPLWVEAAMRDESQERRLCPVLITLGCSNTAWRLNGLPGASTPATARGQIGRAHV